MANRFDGIIMYRRDYRERDLLVKILTRQAGKRMFMLKNAKRPSYPLAGDVLPFTLGQYEGKLNPKGLSFLDTAIQTTHFQNVTEDIVINAYFTYIIGLLDAAYEDGQPMERWFDMTVSALAKLDAGMDPQVIANMFAIQLLGAFGVQPELRTCVLCGRNDMQLDYSEKFNGLICARHWNDDEHRLELSAKAVFYIQQFSVVDLAKVNSINVGAETKADIQKFIDLLYENSVGIHIRAKRFLDQMAKWQNVLVNREKGTEE